MSSTIDQWPILKNALDKKRIPQAMMFVGAAHIGLEKYTQKVLHYLFCTFRTTEPCLNCLDCTMVDSYEHPDMQWIRPEKAGSAIKIDQIRSLQNTVYLSPQRAAYKVIIIDGAETMNESSANALLKILEEPSENTLFILLCKQIGSVLPTITSRCQLSFFSNPDDWSSAHLFNADLYEDTNKITLIENSERILEGIISLLEGKKHVCQLVPEWIQYDLASTLWFLNLMYSQLQSMYLFKESYAGYASEQINRLFAVLNPRLVFNQMDKINSVSKKLSHNINMNHTLVLEDILFSVSSGL